MMKRPLLTYAIKNNVLTCISDVESGIKCGCICPCCGETLVAHKGNKVTHHFKHYKSDECEGGYQTSLHLLAKEILSNESRFVIPPVIYNFNQNGNFISIPAMEIRIDKIELETKLGNVIPDIILYSGKQRLIVEIYVTHRVDKQKLEKIKELDMSTIEIDLSNIDRAVTKDELEDILMNEHTSKKWIFNSYVCEWEKRLFSVAKKYDAVHRYLKSGITVDHIDNWVPPKTYPKHQKYDIIKENQ